MTPRDRVKVYAENTPIGVTDRFVCPWCLSPEKSLTVTRDSADVYAWCCHRASCDKTASRGSNKTFVWERGDPTAPLPLPQFSPTYLPDKATLTVDAFDPRWQRRFKHAGHPLDAATALRVGLYSDAYVLNRVYWRCRSLDGEHLGYQQRDEGYGAKRIKTYREAPGAFYYSTPIPDLSNPLPIVLVEDPFSAALVGLDGGISIALLRTSMSDTLSLEIPRGTRYIVALDPGAEADAEALLRRLRGVGLDAYWMPLRRDLKDLPEADRLHLLRHYGAIPPS